MVMQVDIDDVIVEKIDSLGYEIIKVGIPKRGDLVYSPNSANGVVECDIISNNYYIIIKKKWECPDYLRGMEVFLGEHGSWLIRRNDVIMLVSDVEKFFGIEIPRKESVYIWIITR